MNDTNTTYDTAVRDADFDVWNSYMPEQEVYRAEANPDPLPYGRP